MQRTCILALIVFLPATIFAQLMVDDPTTWWTTYPEQATIEEAEIHLEPQGVFCKVGLVLTISAQGSQYQNNDLAELVMDFSLPENSIIDDSWLWFGPHILEAELRDKLEATQTYNSFIVRQTDPSILYKLSPTDYQIRIYPLLDHGVYKRKIRINYLVPVRIADDMHTVPLPIDIIRMSKVIPDCEVYIQSDYFHQSMSSSWNNLSIQSTGIRSWAGTLKNHMIRTNNTIEITYDDPFNGDMYMQQYFLTAQSGYYQFYFDPAKEFAHTPNPIYLVLAVEFNPNKAVMTKYQLIQELYDFLDTELVDTDFFKLFVNGNSVYQMSTSWTPADKASIQSGLNSIPWNTWHAKMTSNQFITQCAGLLANTQAGTQVVYMSNKNDYLTSQSFYNDAKADADANKVVSAFPSGIKLHTIGFQEFHPGGATHTTTSGNGSVFANEHFLSKIAASTNGEFLDNSTASYSRTGVYNYQTRRYISDYIYENHIAANLRTLSSVLDNFVLSYSMQLQIDNGSLYDRIQLGTNAGFQLRKPYVEFGKFTGTGSIVSFDLAVTTPFQALSLQDTVDTYFTGDSAVKHMWAGVLLADWESLPNTSSFQRTIADTSKKHHVLSKYTAFLALETAADTNCANCNPQDRTLVSINQEMEELAKSLVLFPNPFVDELTIYISLTSVNVNQARITITNMLGQQIKLINLIDILDDEMNLQWDGNDEQGVQAAPGVYFVNLEIDGNRTTKKVVKQ